MMTEFSDARKAPVNPVVVIPSRLASTRLPNKPLADIHGQPMIVHVWRRAVEAAVGPVLVACGDQEIVDAIEAVGGRAVLTKPSHPSGSDRIHEALETVDPKGLFDAVINVQGDLPTIDPAMIRLSYDMLTDPSVDIATMGVEIVNEAERTNPNVVKAIVEPSTVAGAAGRALYFTRVTAPWGEGPLLHHIGLYAYRRDSLRRFVSLPPAVLEQRERLEQLRALANGMHVAFQVVTTVPLGIDTPADLEQARIILDPARQAG